MFLTPNSYQVAPLHAPSPLVPFRSRTITILVGLFFVSVRMDSFSQKLVELLFAISACAIWPYVVYIGSHPCMAYRITAKWPEQKIDWDWILLGCLDRCLSASAPSFLSRYHTTLSPHRTSWPNNLIKKYGDFLFFDSWTL